MRTAYIALGIIVLVGVGFFFLGTKDEIDVTRTLLQGKWVSVQDAKFTREFKDDGTVMDAYEGSSPNVEGNWALFTREVPVEGFVGELEDEPIYLAIAQPESETLYFKITKIDEDTLELIYLNRGLPAPGGGQAGGALIFTKVK